MAAGRHADHGNDLRLAALSVAADRRSRRSKSSPFAAKRWRRRGAGFARLFVRQSAGNSLRARRRRPKADAARLGLSDDADLRAVRPSVLRIRTLQARTKSPAKFSSVRRARIARACWRKFRSKRVAMISGWAVDPNAIYRYQVDAAFPLSDHADYTDLLRYVELVQPKRVLTLHGFAAEFARDLRDRGVRSVGVERAEPTRSCTLGRTCRARRRASGARERIKQANVRKREPQEFRAFRRSRRSDRRDARQAREGATARRIFAHRLDPSSCRSRPFISPAKHSPQSDLRTLQVGWAVIYRALAAASETQRAEFRRIAQQPRRRRQDRLEALEGRTTPEPFGSRNRGSSSTALQKARGPIAKTELLQKRLRQTLGARRSVCGQDPDRRSPDRFARRSGGGSDRNALSMRRSTT